LHGMRDEVSEHPWNWNRQDDICEIISAFGWVQILSSKQAFQGSG